MFVRELGVRYSNGVFRRNIFVEENQVRDFLSNYQTDVFCSALSYGVPKLEERYDSETLSRAVKFGDFYADFDGVNFEHVREDVLTACAYMKAIFRIDYDDQIIYFSGKKGIHLVIPAVVLGITPTQDLHLTYKSLAAEISKVLKHRTLDLRVYDSRRLFRIPGSRHSSTGLYKIQLSVDELQNFSSQDIYAMATVPRILEEREHLPSYPAQAQLKKLREIRDSFGPVRLRVVRPISDVMSDAPLCVRWLLQHPPTRGHRNSACIALASFLFQLGASQKHLREVIVDWAGRTCPPMPLREVESIVERAGLYIYTCRSMRELSECEGALCEFITRKGSSDSSPARVTDVGDCPADRNTNA
ncbi:MAG: hypothetical protein AB1330_01110 [Bacillota bacterium]